jgi:hypothetical protein
MEREGYNEMNLILKRTSIKHHIPFHNGIPDGAMGRYKN